MQFDPNRARSKLQTMSNTALSNLADSYGVNIVNGGRVVSKKRKIALLMQCEAIVRDLGVKGE